MTSRFSRYRAEHPFARNRKAAVSVMFATMVIPLLLIVGIAIDFSFYIQAQAQLNLAADAAAMHAVRAASLAITNGTTIQNAGTLAGQQWFAAQAEPLPGVSLSGTGSNGLPPVTVTINYTAPTYTATVSYTGTINTFFGRLAGVKTWPIAGSATSVIADNFVDIGIMIDNSQSMLIGATQSDINTMDAASPCYPVTEMSNGKYPGLGMASYSYYLNGAGSTYGQGAIGYGLTQTLPPLTPTTPVPNSTDYCDPGYAAGANPPVAACGYPPSVIYGVPGVYGTSATQYYLSKASGGNLVGACNNGGGAPGAAGPNTPQAPCAFACHQSASGDWYAMARAITNQTTGNKVQLRLDVIQSAAQQVVKSMEQYSPSPQTLLSIGLFTFNSSFQPIYPCTSINGCASPFGTDLATAYSDLAVCTGTQTTGCLAPPISGDNPQTDFPDVFSQAANFLAGTQGNGATPATALKDLFIVTDGVSDWNVNGAQMVGPIDQQVVNPCQLLKNQGFTIYVLYTPYYPLPTWTYAINQMPASPVGTYPGGITLGTFATEAEPSSFPDYNANYPTDTPLQAALRACASSASYFYTASSPADIKTAMQAMLSSALNSAARVTQ